MLSIQCKFYLYAYLAFSCISFNSLAFDTVKILRPQSTIVNHHADLKDQLMKRIMEVTEEQYGSYDIVRSTLPMNRSRALINMIKGDTLNVFIGPNTQEWDQKTIVIKIPVRLGLLSYRLLLIHKDDLELFSHIDTAKQLKALTAGLRPKWLTTKIFKQKKFTLIESENYDGLFNLLDKHKFHYFPRSIYEIHDELADRSSLYENLVIEPTLALYIPTPTYVYVSATQPKLAKRISDGLTFLFESGELTKTVEKYYGNAIKKAQLSQRKIIAIENPFYLEADQLNNQKYLYTP